MGTIRAEAVINYAKLLEYGARRGGLMYAFARGEDGRKIFVHPSDCGDVQPQRFDRISFTVDDSDPRGLRARDVQIVQAAVVVPEQLADRTIVCCDCRAVFVWTVAEQRFYLMRRLRTPKRCKPCVRTFREQYPNGMPPR